MSSCGVSSGSSCGSSSSKSPGLFVASLIVGCGLFALYLFSFQYVGEVQSMSAEVASAPNAWKGTVIRVLSGLSMAYVVAQILVMAYVSFAPEKEAPPPSPDKKIRCQCLDEDGKPVCEEFGANDIGSCERECIEVSGASQALVTGADLS